MTLFIDADACPVKEEAERVATRHKVRMVLVLLGLTATPPRSVRLSDPEVIPLEVWTLSPTTVRRPQKADSRAMASPTLRGGCWPTSR